jgi:predicted DNA-binding transcriptional regulator AlpA
MNSATPLPICNDRLLVRASGSSATKRSRSSRIGCCAQAKFNGNSGVSRATAYRLMTDGTLPTYRFGGRKGTAMIRVALQELRAWIAAHKTSEEVTADSVLTQGAMLRMEQA